MNAIAHNETLPARYAALRCPACGGVLSPSRRAAESLAESLECPACRESFPLISGIPRMLLAPLRAALAGRQNHGAVDERRVRTAHSFGYEWTHFAAMRPEWERNFLAYMLPHTPAFFRGKQVLDAGCGIGRHAFYAAKFGARVWAVDLGPAVEVAQRNTADCATVQCVQADLQQLPFAPASFDFVYSIGVLHHLPDPEEAFRYLLRYVKPGGAIQIYLYWQPEGQPVKRLLLAAVKALRQVTTRLPHPLLHALSYPAAAAAFAGFVWPYRLLRLAGLKGLAEKLPMRQYAHYPFGVCVNDQFDRFSAPLEYRYTQAEVRGWLERAGLEEIVVRPNYGWCASGRKPLADTVKTS
ncbi:MAG: methyltransferase domain-containing protein [Acidobacteria bacterium]|nr:methyltransferase domain-containing protein [Acidobacteriota bacterium]MBI3421405.1 methyltransferase domain-containing protein [Acidobacteriota bacterium]